MKLPLISAAVILLSVTTLFADAEKIYSEHNARLSKDYSQLGISMALESCKNKYVSRVKADKSIAFNSTFNAGKDDAYMNRFMYDFFGPDGSIIDPYAKPLDRRTIIDGGDDFAWTPQLKRSSYRVPAGTSMRVVDTGELHWMVRAKPLASVPNYVPTKYYTDKKINSGTPSGYSFAYHLVILHDDTNTPDMHKDDDAISDCVFFYVTE